MTPPEQEAGPSLETARWERRLPGLLGRLELPAEGVVQVGAHTGQEVEALTRCGFRRLVMMEPNRDHIPALERQLRRHHLGAGLPDPAGGHPPREVVVAAAGRDRGEATLHVTEYDQQASMLPPLLPMAVVRQDTVAVIPVREVQHGCDVLIVDAQGAELDVLVGTDLDRLRLAVIEGSTFARYSGGSTLDSIAEHMRSHGWRQVAAWAHVRPHVVDVAWAAPSLDRVSGV
ncbi:FkbM family methyltransferase [Sphaerimonospora thailandensis]|uniref:FkbM family methyltransferase n=1 Tax=Sphaerimonospora thailandensis TaxID=795644 RepID=UPI0019504145|nr:FkbM family methyltransferase [Sphaerimonospora thailandensis]